jgi:AraC family transcriptional regulator
LLSLSPLGAPYAFSWDTEVENLIIFIAPELVASLVGEITRSDPAHTQLIWHFNFDDALVQAVCRALLAELRSDAPLGPLYAESLAQTLVLHLLRHYSNLGVARPLPAQGLSRRQVQQVRDFIHDHYRTNLRLSDLAAVAGLSPAHFARQFKQATGLSPHQYLIHYRVERARDLLMGGVLSVAQAAQVVGFADQSHLTRHFKRHLGYLPRDVLQNRKNLPK